MNPPHDDAFRSAPILPPATPRGPRDNTPGADLDRAPAPFVSHRTGGNEADSTPELPDWLREATVSFDAGDQEEEQGDPADPLGQTLTAETEDELPWFLDRRDEDPVAELDQEPAGIEGSAAQEEGDDAHLEVAERLESIARSLRERAEGAEMSELDDPLEILIHGYALGYLAGRRRPG